MSARELPLPSLDCFRRVQASVVDMDGWHQNIVFKSTPTKKPYLLLNEINSYILLFLNIVHDATGARAESLPVSLLMHEYKLCSLLIFIQCSDFPTLPFFV